MSDGRPEGWVEMHTMGRSGHTGQTIRLPKAPEAKEVITWPQRPQSVGPMVRVKVLKSEGGLFPGPEPGDVIDVSRAWAQPRLRDGRMRLARPDEPLTSVGIV